MAQDKKITTVIEINDVKIVVKNGAVKLVPIKPICELLGIDRKNQQKKIQTDEILHSVGVLSTLTGRDGKEYEMFCIPYKFVFGWLFTINPKNVAEHARANVIRYKLECYNALYQHFTAQSDFLEEKQRKLEKKMVEIQGFKTAFSSAKSKLTAAEKELRDIRNLDFEEWRKAQQQLKLDI